MAETVYGTEDSTMVMSEKVKIQKIDTHGKDFKGGGGRVNEGKSWNHDEKCVKETRKKPESLSFSVSSYQLRGISLNYPHSSSPRFIKNEMIH